MLKPGHKSNENDRSTCISGEGSGWEHGEGVSQFYMEVDASVVLRITRDTPIDTIVLGIEAEAPHNTFDVRPLPAKMPTARFSSTLTVWSAACHRHDHQRPTCSPKPPTNLPRISLKADMNTSKKPLAEPKRAYSKVIMGAVGSA